MVIRRKARAQERPARPRGGWRKGLIALAALLPVVSVLAVTAPASAHANVVTGVASCQTDGTYTVTWTVANDFNKSVAVTLVQSTGGGTLSGLPVTIAASPGQPYKSATVTQTGVPGSTTSAKLTVKGVWADGYSQNDSKTISLSGNCTPTHTPAAPTATQPTCAVLTGTIHIPTDAGVTYKVDGTTRTGDATGLSLGAHTVTASSSTLTLTNPTSWTFTFVATSQDCRTQIPIPAEPRPTPPTCSTDGSLTLVNGDHYTWSDNKAPNVVGTHTVTATAAQGFVFTNGKTTQTYTVEVLGATNNCSVELVAPTVVQPRCTGPGTSSPGSITPGTSAHVTYVLNGTVVTATTQVPYAFSPTSGWVLSGDHRTATYTVTLIPAGDCLTEVIPVVPDVVQSVCTGPGTHSDPVITPADTVGITYSVNGTVVTATPKTGYKLGTAPGWVAGPNGTATYTVTLTDPGACLVETIPVAPSVEQSVCTGPGTSSDPVITPADTVGITYTVNGNVVTATANTGYVLDASAPWVLDKETGTATYTVTFTDPGSCLVIVVPVAPTVQQAVCTGPGTSTEPVITPATTEHITYAVNGNVVTATPDQGYALGASDGWTIDQETGIGSYTVTLVVPDCTVIVTIVDPTITTAQECGVASTFTIPETAGVTYLLDGEPIAPGTYSTPTNATITAQAQQGYALSNSEWSFTVNLPATIPCPTVVTPVDPTIDPSAQCGVEGTYTIASTEGIDYLLDGTVVEAGTYDGPASGTVTARAQEGFTLDSSAWSFALELPAAETPCDLPNTGGKLPQTGAQAGWIVGAGAAALLVGLLLVLAGRRREDTIGEV
jgi:LPXTG-motif cell wall-anchored protein